MTTLSVLHQPVRYAEQAIGFAPIAGVPPAANLSTRVCRTGGTPYPPRCRGGKFIKLAPHVPEGLHASCGRMVRQRRSLTKALVREAVERYLEALAEEIAAGEWVDIPGIGKLQVSREEGKGYVTSITPGGQRVRRKVQIRLRTKVRLYDAFKRRRRQN